MAFDVEPLPYDYNALDPTIDEQTMRLHHDKHYATYVTNANNALQNQPDFANKSGEEILRSINEVPEDIRTTVRNNVGGAVNHAMFWKIMSPDGGGEPTGAIAEVINGLGGFENFKSQFNDAGAKRFGSGWVWLVRTPDGQYQITSTANQDSPFMDGNYPIFGNDVWEHAYYLKYNNRRPEYLSSWWNVVNWDEINNRLQQAGG